MPRLNTTTVCECRLTFTPDEIERIMREYLSREHEKVPKNSEFTWHVVPERDGIELAVYWKTVVSQKE